MTPIIRTALRAVIAGDTAKDLVKLNSPLISTHRRSPPRWLRNARIKTVPRCCPSLKFRVLTFQGLPNYMSIQQKWSTDHKKALKAADAVITSNIFLGHPVFAIPTLYAAMTRAAPLQLFRPRGQFTLKQLHIRTSKHFSHFSSYLAALSSEYCSHSQVIWLCCASARRPPVGNIACTRVTS